MVYKCQKTTKAAMPGQIPPKSFNNITRTVSDLQQLYAKNKWVKGQGHKTKTSQGQSVTDTRTDGTKAVLLYPLRNTLHGDHKGHKIWNNLQGFH